MKKDLINFERHVKHLRSNSCLHYEYHHDEVRKRFFEVLDILGAPCESDLIAFITLRLKGCSDWVTANSAANALEWKLSKYFWGRKSRHKKLPFVSSVEHNPMRIKDHLHILVRLTDLKQRFTSGFIANKIDLISRSLNEVNERNPDSVMVSIFPYRYDLYELGNKVEYICKTSSKSFNPIQRHLPNSNIN